MDLNSAWIFVRVVQSGSLSAAARQLQIPVSTVSTKISQLEERLGVSLLIRTTRKLQLTEAGSRYLQLASEACKAIEAAEASTTSEQQEASGLVRMTAPVEMGSTLLTDAISQFKGEHPKVQVELILTDRVVDLVGEGIDLAVRIGALEDSTLVAKKIGSSYFQAYASPSYLKKHGEPRTPQDLRKHDCLNFQGPVKDVWELQKGGKRAQVEIQGSFSANNLVALQRLALQGRGIALLPRYFCLEDVADGRLRHVLKGYDSDRFVVHLVYPNQKFIPLRVRLMMDFMARNLQNVF
jgi:DNA-binding transcriptional LysR family regulator